MRWRKCLLVTGAVVLAVGFAGYIGAEDPDRYEGRDVYGDVPGPEYELKWGLTDPTPIALPSTAFTGVSPVHDSRFQQFWSYRWCFEPCYLVSPIYPPHGSLIPHIWIRGYDSNPSGRVTCFLEECPDSELDCTSIEQFGTDDPFDAGDFTIHAWLDPALYVDLRYNSYQISCTIYGDNLNTRIQNIHMDTFLQISRAPATATFDDVPVGAFGFQHVEALAASGITAGCDASNFCPDDPVTRVQMAVFLAKALGLHWAN